MEKQIELKFLYVKASVRVWGKPWNYSAQIRFPYAYMEPVFNNYRLDDVFTPTIEKALETAVSVFKGKYRFLDKVPRQIHQFNFFVHKAKFQKLTHRVINGQRFTFLNSDYVYAISENVDGKKYPKSQFARYNELDIIRALMLINYKDIFQPMHDAGFTFKLISRVIAKNNITPVKKLRLFVDHTNYIINPDQLLYNYIRLPGQEELLQQLVYRHKIITDLKKPNIP
jgi:hypothetical protein